MGRNPVLLGRLYIYHYCLGVARVRCTFVLYFRRDSYRLKSGNPVHIVFCSQASLPCGVMLASPMFSELVRLKALFQ
jgi:hypothetical protein